MVMEFHSESFRGVVAHSCETQMRALNAYSAPLPWIGMYIAAASLVCGILVVADLVYAFRWRKYWLPSKYFTLNAATLTLLGVVVKLSLDISSPMPTESEGFAKLCNLVLMVTVMANFSISLGSMDGKSLVSNMIALVILVVTVSVNVIIQIKTGLIHHDQRAYEKRTIICMFIMLILLIYLALAVPTMKKNIEVQYFQKYEKVLNEESLREGKLTTARLELVIKKLWIMAVTSNPQFVFAHSVAWVFPFYFNCLSLLILFSVFGAKFHDDALVTIESLIFQSSDYSWSINWILIIQSIGSVIGILVFILRTFVVFIFGLNSRVDNIQQAGNPNFRIKSLIRIRNPKIRKLVYRICQNGMISVLVGFVSSVFLSFYGIRKLIVYIIDQIEQEATVDVEMAHLAGPVRVQFCKLFKMEIKMICYELRQLTLTGKRKQPKNLLQLLQRSNGFIGVSSFDHMQVPSLHEKEPPSCWTLPVMTLATIAIALPTQDIHSVDNIIKCVTEGLKYADLVDKSLEVTQKLQNIRHAVKVAWQDVELDHKWLNVKPVMRMSREGKSSKEILLCFADLAKNRVDEYKEGIEEAGSTDHIYWPDEVVAANSMYRISSTLLLAYDEERNAQTTAAEDDRLCEKVLDMIADILSACLTNLPYLMTRQCYGSTIEKMEDRVRKVARLFGKCEEIMKLLEARQVPDMDPEKALCIDEWQAYVSTPTPNNANASPSPEVEHVANQWRTRGRPY